MGATLGFGGLLTGWISPPRYPLGYNQTTGAESSHASDPTLPNNHMIGQSYARDDACTDIEYMIMLINNYNGGTRGGCPVIRRK